MSLVNLPLFLEAVAERHKYPLLFATVSGAHLYGFPSPDSDYDLRGVHILPLHKVIGLGFWKGGSRWSSEACSVACRE